MVPVLGQNKYILPDPYQNWDGITHWSKYLILSPAYMGPNALPGPRISSGRVNNQFGWSGYYEYYFSDGDLTQDFKTELSIPIGNKGAIEFRYVPVEFYQVDSSLSRHRRSFRGDQLDGYSLGDVYFGAHLQLIKDIRFLPDLEFSMFCRTASGTGRDDVRHTDTPGYYFDLSTGKSFGDGKGFFNHVRVYGSMGFYVWQTYLDDYPQNDALLFGLGVHIVFRDFYLDQSIRGYSGYMYNGDHPLVYSVDLGIRIGAASLVLGYETGLRDFPFSSIRTGIVINGLNE